MQKRVDRIVKDLSLKHGLPTRVIKNIVESQFQCARANAISAKRGEPDTFKNIKFKHLGRLIVRPATVLKLTKYYKEKLLKDKIDE